MASPQFTTGILSQLVTKGNTTPWGTAPDLIGGGGAGTTFSRTFNVASGPPNDPSGMPLLHLQCTFRRQASTVGICTVTFNVHNIVNLLHWGDDVPGTAGSGQVSITMPADLLAHQVSAYMLPRSLVRQDAINNTFPVVISGVCDSNGVACDLTSIQGRLIYIPLTP
jgi:hypothetical protein